MNRIVKIILGTNLIVLVVLVFIYPHLMVGPGKLIPGHKQLSTDCFACHEAFNGATSERCIRCHKPTEIGRLTTSGLPIIKPLTSVPFHQKLTNQDCVACHSDHAGVKRFHSQGSFNHTLLQKTALDQCQTCHKPPIGPLHNNQIANCSQCHELKHWTPATFDHNQYFVLDQDHHARCVTCHTGNDYGNYTCYGCHEHTLANIRREHIEEGIRNFNNCVECHRSADENDIRSSGGEGKRGSHNEHDNEHDDD